MSLYKSLLDSNNFPSRVLWIVMGSQLLKGKHIIVWFYILFFKFFCFPLEGQIKEIFRIKMILYLMIFYSRYVKFGMVHKTLSLTKLALRTNSDTHPAHFFWVLNPCFFLGWDHQASLNNIQNLPPFFFIKRKTTAVLSAGIWCIYNSYPCFTLSHSLLWFLYYCLEAAQCNPS